MRQDLTLQIALMAAMWVRTVSAFSTPAPRKILSTSSCRFVPLQHGARRIEQQQRHQCRYSIAVHGINSRHCCIRLFSATSSDQAATSSSFALRGIGWLQDAVVVVLNDLYDPKEVAKGNLQAKWNKSAKKKSKKKESNDNENDESSTLSDADQQSLLDQAAAAARSFTRRDAMVTPATKPEFGDYQINAAMGLSQALGMHNPRHCATQIVAALQPRLDDVCDDLEIAGPGFINVRLRQPYLTQAVQAMAANADDRCAVPVTAQPQTVCVDYSSPNIAKEMHVGHLRSTIIGDTIANVLQFAGHDVKRFNHVGDWGTQFGMLVEHLRDEMPAALAPGTDHVVQLGDLVTLYKAAKNRFDVDNDFKERARQGVVALQAGDAEAVAAWEALCTASRIEFDKIYQRLSISSLVERGESFYNDYLPDVVHELEQQGLAVESDGAVVVFLQGYTNRDGSPLPMIVRKRDGGYNYATTDLAAIRQRTLLAKSDRGEQADRVLYVVDAGQSLHFEMVFAAAKKAGLAPEHVQLEHVPFGVVQGEDGKKFATRSGETVKLKDLLDKAVEIAAADLQERNPNANAATLAHIDAIAHIVGVGAVKYADLSMNRESNYRFSFARMLSLSGNTAPYMLYAYARICGIVRKVSQQEDVDDIVWPTATDVIVTDDTELELIRNLVKLPDVIDDVSTHLYPNRMCDYLFDTTQKFSQFYESCSVSNAATAHIKASRLTLCTATAGTIRLLLGLLGIQVVERL